MYALSTLTNLTFSSPYSLPRRSLPPIEIGLTAFLPPWSSRPARRGAFFRMICALPVCLPFLSSFKNLFSSLSSTRSSTAFPAFARLKLHLFGLYSKICPHLPSTTQKVPWRSEVEQKRWKIFILSNIQLIPKIHPFCPSRLYHPKTDRLLVSCLPPPTT